jgi:hypothetical protein
MKCYCGKKDATIKLSHPIDRGFIPICSNEECKDQVLQEIDDIKFRVSHQGRSRNSYGNSVKINILIFLLCMISCSLIIAYCIFKKSVNC